MGITFTSVPKSVSIRRLAGAFTSMIFAFGICFASAETADDYASQLAQARLFTQPLMWVGTNAPSLRETYELYEAAGLDASQPKMDRITAFEGFVRNHGDSPWTPS